MEAPPPSPAPATYEIHLQGDPSDAMVARFAPSRVTRRRAQTVLTRRATSQEELAALLERVLTLRLPLQEVRQLRTAPREYEVRIDGELQETLLRFLRWQHRHQPEQAELLLEGTPEDVHAFLSDCCRLELGIERVRRVSSDRARDRAALPRPAG